MALNTDCLYIIATYSRYRDILSLLTTNRVMSEMNTEQLWYHRLNIVYGAIEMCPPMVKSWRNVSYKLSAYGIDLHDVIKCDLHESEIHVKTFSVTMTCGLMKEALWRWQWQDEGDCLPRYFYITDVMFGFCREEIEKNNGDNDLIACLMHYGLDCNKEMSCGDNDVGHSLLALAIRLNNRSALDVMLLGRVDRNTITYALEQLKDHITDVSVVDAVIGAAIKKIAICAIINMLIVDKSYTNVIENLYCPTDMIKNLLLTAECKYTASLICGNVNFIDIIRLAAKYNNKDALRNNLAAVSDQLLGNNIKLLRVLMIVRYKDILLNRIGCIADPALQDKCLSVIK